MGGNSSSKRIVDKEKEDSKGKCLVCHPNGIVIAYSVFRCSICPHTSDSVNECRQHYDKKHLRNGKLRKTFGNFEPIVLQLDKSCQPNDTIDFRSSTPCSELVHDVSENGINVKPLTDSGVSIDPKGAQMFKGDVRSVSKLSVNGTPRVTPKCSVCQTQRQYACVQRRLGVYVCAYCFRFLRVFLSNPRVYNCPELGKCPINEKSKCDACWIKACIDVYISELDAEKQAILRRYYPVSQINSPPNKNRSRFDLAKDLVIKDAPLGNGEVKSGSLLIDAESGGIKEVLIGEHEEENVYESNNQRDESIKENTSPMNVINA
ncbi:nuclear receptor-like protein [Dinothrombium tinctorium]|uniref:Nuclear receptor-like protein n=1 Tax=Dinothrombium tinctorium TaxID=1965070 RepID=A0A3S3PBX5_9ACAR|nr:nuclear receptor-like protein [Dinothrombium tinctorium]